MYLTKTEVERAYGCRDPAAAEMHLGSSLCQARASATQDPTARRVMPSDPLLLLLVEVATTVSPGAPGMAAMHLAPKPPEVEPPPAAIRAAVRLLYL